MFLLFDLLVFKRNNDFSSVKKVQIITFCSREGWLTTAADRSPGSMINNTLF